MTVHRTTFLVSFGTRPPPSGVSDVVCRDQKVGPAVVVVEIVWLVVDDEKTWIRASQGDKGTNWAFGLKIAQASGTRDGFKCSLWSRTLAESVVSG